MKIKDIITSLGNVKSKVHIAYRINKCSPQIKQAIAQLYKDRVLPKIEMGIQSPDGNGYFEVSLSDLVSLYGMDDLAALLFLDDLDKANAKSDKTDLWNLLGMLSIGKHQSRMVVTDELLEYVQKSAPDVWDSYQKIVEKENTVSQDLENDYEKVIENEL